MQKEKIAWALIALGGLGMLILFLGPMETPNFGASMAGAAITLQSLHQIQHLRGK